MVKILFVIYDNEGAQNPIPMGACYIAAYLKKHGIDDISFYNQDVYHYPEEHLTEHLNKNHYDIIGLGFVAGYHQHKKIKAICAAVNKSKDRPLVVLGGHGPTPVPDYWLSYTGADAAVMGEGEIPFLNLVRAYEAGKSPVSINGVVTRYKTPPRENPIQDLDSIPFPYYDKLPMEYYHRANRYMNLTDRFLPLITSRGCPFKCNFCLRLEKNIRFRSPESIDEELGKYVRDYRLSFVQFWDDLFIASEERVYELTRVIKKHKIHYWCTGRVGIVNRNIMKMLKESGCVYIDYGIEQFDNEALKAMDKRQTEEQILNAIKVTYEQGINISHNFLFGNLGDTEESLRKSRDLLKKYNDYGELRTVRPPTPYPGTPLYYTAIERGLLKGAGDFYKKHTNLELPTVNFTKLSDDRLVELLFEANKEIITDYYAHCRDEMIDNFSDTYFRGAASFRGARHK